jgi:DNA-binding MarR family transcriptional regulator
MSTLPHSGSMKLPHSGSMKLPHSGHPIDRLDDVVHQRVRLGLLSVLTEVDQADFTFLRERLGLSDGNLSRHLQVLEDAGFVESHKVFEGRRPRTWVTSTRAGRQAFRDELEALSDLVRSHTDHHDVEKGNR